jgi:hypothetical protein
MWKSTVILLASTVSALADFSALPHPRLWLTRSGEPALREKITRDPLAAKLNAAVLAEAGRILQQPTCRYEIPDGKRLLAQSRLALHHISHSAWAWRLTGRGEFRVRAIAELDAACALKDWNPSHFLDTAEMATAVAWGYDWLHETLTPEQRKTYGRALIDKALKPARDIYRRNNWWTRPRNNWSQVCGAGISIAALALAGSDEGLTAELFPKGLRLVESCANFYQPDGMYPEGPGYWHYGTNYHVLMLAVCKPLGISFNDAPVLRRAGLAMMHLTSPTLLGYNFADGGARREIPSPAQSWIASHYIDPAQSAHVRDLLTRSLGGAKEPSKSDRYGPLSVLWLPADPGDIRRPTAGEFKGEQAMALFRTGWETTDAWLAIKGGTPAASHGHMDVGSFVYDARGERWFHDLGADNYNLPGYFGDKRWDYHRLQNRSHNTLEIAGRLQNPEAAPCPQVSSSTSGAMFSAAFDLSAAYDNSAAKVLRSANFDSDSGVVVLRDEITAPRGEIIWRALTNAKAEIRGNEVVLTRNKQGITVRRLSDAGAWSIAKATPPTAVENQNEGFRAVTLTVPPAEMVTIEVELRPWFPACDDSVRRRGSPRTGK